MRYKRLSSGFMSRPHWGTLLTFSPGWTITDEFEGYLQVSKSSLYKLAQDGKVPGQKVGRHWRFHRATIDRWLACRSEREGAQ